MTSSSAGRAMRLTAGALCVLVGFGVVSSTPAQAGCGHYVVSSFNRSGLESISDLEVLRLADTAQAPAAPRRDLPCSGPTCSRGQGSPQAPVPPPTLRTDPCCCTVAAPPFAGPEPAEDLSDSSPRHPQRIALALERPPRFPALVCLS